MKDNPGLLPLKLGNAQNAIDSWSFVQIFDITSLIENFYNLQGQYVRIKNAFENNTQITDSYKKAFINSYNIATFLQNRILEQINQLNPIVNNRKKRGLINAIGSIIKTITGNLDQEDAEKYEKAIEKLSTNQSRLKTSVKDQITLFQKAIDVFKASMQNLTQNQLLLKSRIDHIEDVFYALEAQAIGTYYFFYTEMVISQLTTEFQAIYDIFERIETAITFSKMNILHNSIIQPNELLNEIQYISKYLTTTKLPFEPNKVNILMFEKISRIKSYSSENKIIFIIEIPTVESQMYNFYHLYPMPVMKDNSYQLIIPKSKYLMINEQNHFFSNENCFEIIPEEFICHEAITVKSQEKSPCEVQLLKMMTNVSNCQPIPVEITDIKIQKVELNKWIIVSPDHTVAVQKCGKTSENIPLKGSYLVELNPDCVVKIKDFLLQNLKNNKNKFKQITLPSIDYSKPNYNLASKFSAFKLDDVNLNELQPIKEALEAKKQEMDKIEDTSIVFNSIDGWTILIYVILILILLFVIYRFLKSKYYAPKKQKETSEEVIMMASHSKQQNSEVNPRILR